jgi:hypothetical protein
VIYRQEYIDYLITASKPVLFSGNSLAIELLNNPGQFNYTQTEVFDIIYNMISTWSKKESNIEMLSTLSYSEFIERERNLRLDKIVQNESNVYSKL